MSRENKYLKEVMRIKKEHNRELMRLVKKIERDLDKAKNKKEREKLLKLKISLLKSKF